MSSVFNGVINEYGVTGAYYRTILEPPAGEVQAVRFGSRTWGVQLHPEVDAAVLRPWAESDREAHVLRGVDQETLLHSIEEAADELSTAWRPLAIAWAAIVRGVA